MCSGSALHDQPPGLTPSFDSMQVQTVPWSSAVEDSANTEQIWLAWTWSATDSVPTTMCPSPPSTHHDKISDLPSPVGPPRTASFGGSCDSNNASPPADAEAKKERRRAQNRVAQQAFRERKVQRFRDFQGEVETLNNTISRLEGENSDLRTSLRDARTEIEILRSMLPQITRIMTPDQAPMSKSDQDQQLQALLLKLGLNGILRGIAASNGLEP